MQVLCNSELSLIICFRTQICDFVPILDVQVASIIKDGIKKFLKRAFKKSNVQEYAIRPPNVQINLEDPEF